MWGPIVGALSGLSGVSALVKVRVDGKRNRGDLAATLSTSAQGWIEYTDRKFEAVSRELADHVKEQRTRDRLRAELHEEHRRWDIEVKTQVENLTGEALPDPPPLDITPAAA